jgi:integrase
VKDKLQRTRVPNIFRKDNGKFVWRGNIEGKAWKRTLQAASLKAAVIEAEQLVRSLRRGGGRVGRSRAAVSFAEEVEEWLNVVRATPGSRPSTIQTKIWASQFFQHAFGRKQLVEINREELEGWWAELARMKRENGKKLSGRSLNLTLSCISAVFERRVGRGIEVNPCVYLHAVPLEEKKPQMPNRQMFEMVLKEMRNSTVYSPAAVDMVEFLAYSGARIGEARLLRWSDIKADRIIIHGVKRTGWRTIPIFPRLKVVIDRMRAAWPKEPSGSARVFPIDSPRSAFRGACDRLGFERIRIHDLRHLFATRAMEKGIPVGTIAKWLGHKDGGALLMRTYAHVRDDVSFEQAKLLD